MGGAWEKIFINAESIDFWKLENMQELFNININLPILNELYILLYNSLGLSRTYIRGLDFIVHANDFGAPGWLSPVTLIIILSPIYFAKSKEILILSLIFVFLFLFWTNGIQYNRVFLASSTVCIIILALCINIKKNFLYNFLSKSFFYLSILTCLILTLYHTDVSLRMNPYGLKVLFNEQYKFQDNLVKSLARTEWDKYIKNDISLFMSKDKKNLRYNSKEKITDFFYENDIKKINSILYKKKIDLIIHDLETFPHLHTLLNKGNIIFLKDFTKVDEKIKNIDKKKTCFLYKDKKELSFDTSIIFNNDKGINLNCKNNNI